MNHNLDVFYKRKDILYFVLSIMVVFIHTVAYRYYDNNGIEILLLSRGLCDYFRSYITLCAVPTFMFFNGYLFFCGVNGFNDIIKKIKRRIYSIGVPFVLWNIISMLYTLILGTLPLDKYINNLNVFSFSWSNVLKGVFLYAYHPVNWYLAQILIFTVLTPIFYLLLKKKRLGCFVIIVSSIVFILNLDIPFILNRKEILFFYLLGCFVGMHFGDRMINYEPCLGKKRALLIIIFLIIPCAIFVSENSIIILIVSLGQMIILWMLLCSIDVSKITIPWWVKSSFFIYEIHSIFIISIIDKLLWIILPHNSFFVVFNIFIAVAITIVISILVAYILKKYFNCVWKLLMGNRL